MIAIIVQTKVKVKVYSINVVDIQYSVRYSHYHMNPVGFIYRNGTMCSVQQESRAFSSDRNSAPEDSIKTLIVLLYSTLFSVYVCIF